MSMIKQLVEIDARAFVGTACQVSFQHKQLLSSSRHDMPLQMLRAVRHLLSCMR